jgi:hypothetical protein
MRICTQCGHKLSGEEYLCPACDLWDSRSYSEPKKSRRALPMATVFVGPFQHALLIRQLCEGAGIPAVIDGARGASGKGGSVARVQVPHDRAGEVVAMLSSAGSVSTQEVAPRGPGLRRKRSHLRARLSLRRRAYQALAWAMFALVFPPAGAVAIHLACGVLSENRGLPVVTEETRVARASLVISSAAMVVFLGVIAVLVRGVGLGKH